MKQPTCPSCKIKLKQVYWWKNGKKLESIDGSYECTQCGKEVNTL